LHLVKTCPTLTWDYRTFVFTSEKTNFTEGQIYNATAEQEVYLR